MLSFIHQNYYKSISLQDIDESANMNIAQCYRYFKMIVKMSPYDYLIHYLLGSTFNITEISEKVGFQNVNHYIQTFKKAYTLSPKKYQKNIKKGIYNNANSFSFFHLTISIQHK
ncbi:helix-turn-helix domain-containing protein [Faecalibacillus intestinalis]|uniref:helix-turn-helix domain-containing protein n=1 Tax=Faecalibacillus intestinalis TaxID=1982626 RepID=UPI00352283B5